MIELVKRAIKFSKRIAVISNQTEYNYDQLLRKSNSIAMSEIHFCFLYHY